MPHSKNFFKEIINILLKTYGDNARKYLNVLQPINLDDFENSLSNDYVILGGELDAYFKLVKDL